MKTLDTSHWRIYNRAVISSLAPHNSPSVKDVEALSEKYLLHLFLKRKAFFALYTSDFDSAVNFPFWYVIKDGGYDFNALKSNSRRQIRRGNESFIVKKINPLDYKKEMYDVFCSAMKGYDESERSYVKFEDFSNWYKNSSDRFLGAFVRSDDGKEGELVGYKIYSLGENGCINQMVQKVKVEWERKHVAHALENALLEDVSDELKSGKYVCCGWRNLNHKTHNEDFLEEHFLFRKAHCFLHIKGCTLFWVFVALLSPFYAFLEKSNKKSLYAFSSVLRMVKVYKECKKIMKKDKNITIQMSRERERE